MGRLGAKLHLALHQPRLLCLMEQLVIHTWSGGVKGDGRDLGGIKSEVWAVVFSVYTDEVPVIMDLPD